MYILTTDKFRLVYDETQIGPICIYILYTRGFELIIFKLIFRLALSRVILYLLCSNKENDGEESFLKIVIVQTFFLNSDSTNK